MCLLGICLWANTASGQQERITSFDSDVLIYRSGELEVTETITVEARGRSIRRGLFRDFPRERGRYWYGPHRVSFDVLAVTRNGIIDMTAVTGAFGERKFDASTAVTKIGTGVMATTQPLRPGEGVTVTARLPADAVTPPDSVTRLSYLLRDGAPV